MSLPALLATRRFLPLFVAQFLGAFNDNLFKNALMVWLAYRAAEGGAALVAIAGGIFILPFFLFSAIAGQAADKYDRVRIARVVKIVEMILALCALAGFLFSSVPFLMAALFALGAHSTFFSPVKYVLLPQHLREEELLQGNALVEAATFLAILTGSIIGGLLIAGGHGQIAVPTLMLCMAAAGYAAARFIPPAPAPVSQLRMDWNIPYETWKIIRHSAASRDVFFPILGISWFYFMGAAFLAQVAPFARSALHADETVVTLFLAGFSLGVGAGSLLASKVFRNRDRSSLRFIAVLGISLGALPAAWCAGASVAVTGGSLMGAWDFLLLDANWSIFAGFCLIALCGGFFVVPLYVRLQQCSDTAHRARNIAANNIMNALAMTVSALLLIALIRSGFDSQRIFLTLAALNAAIVTGAWVICRMRKARRL